MTPRVERVPLRRLFTVINGGTPTPDSSNWGGGVPWATPVDLAKVDGHSIARTDRTLTDEGLRSGSRLVPPGSIVVSTRAPIGYVATVEQETAFNQGCRGLVPRDAGAVDVRFVKYQLVGRREDLQAAGNGTTFQELPSEALASFRVAYGPIGEQRRIADFLDAETARIDALIAAKQKMIAAASARYRATVVSDLANSRSAPLKRSALLVDCKHRTATYVAEGYPVVSPGDVTAGELDLSRCHRFVTRSDWLDLADGPRKPRVGDIVYSRNASIGLAALVTTGEAFCMGQDVCLVRPQRKDGDGRFLTHVLNTVGLDQIDRLKVGSTFFRVNVAQIAELQIPVADEFDQDQLVLRWDDELDWYQRLLTTLSRQIGLLKERRQALITAAVSGELAV